MFLKRRNSGLLGGFRLFAGAFSDPCIRMSVTYCVVCEVKDILVFFMFFEAKIFRPSRVEFVG